MCLVFMIVQYIYGWICEEEVSKSKYFGCTIEVEWSEVITGSKSLADDTVLLSVSEKEFQRKVDEFYGVYNRKL